MRRARRATIIGAVVLGIALGSAGPALATQVQASGYQYIGHLKCGWGQVWLDNDLGKPRLQSIATMDAWDGRNLCGNTSAAAGTNQLRVAQDLLVYNWATGAWLACNVGPLILNHWGPSHQVYTGFAWASPPCRQSHAWGTWFMGAVRTGVVDTGGGWYPNPQKSTVTNAIGI